MTDPQAIAKGLSEAQKRAVREGRVTECPYNHPAGTKCPNCALWPFKKGGASEFVSSVGKILEASNETL